MMIVKMWRLLIWDKIFFIPNYELVSVLCQCYLNDLWFLNCSNCFFT